MTHVHGLGAEGDQVAVADGYARNFLFPKNLAVIATSAALRRIESLKLLRTERERKELEQAQELAKKISKLSSTVELQTGENGKVFGSVTSSDIANALTSRGFEIDRKAIILEEPIKKLGTFDVPVRLHPQVNATFKLTITSPNQPAPSPTSSNESKGKTTKAKASKKKS